MRNKNGGLTSTIVKERYNQKTYDKITIRLRKNAAPTKDDLNKAVSKARETDQDVSLNSWIVDAIVAKIGGSNDIVDLDAYARSAGLTPDEYIRQAVRDKMQRQDAEYMDDVIRVQ